MKCKLWKKNVLLNTKGDIVFIKKGPKFFLFQNVSILHFLQCKVSHYL